MDFVGTSEFRALATSYQDIDGIKAPMTVRTAAAAPGSSEEPAAPRPTTPPSAARRWTMRPSSRRSRRRPTSARCRRPRARAKDADVTIESLEALVEFFIAAGKKGFDVNRYKGLGEMNPDTLWETTMDPAKRTLLQVKAEDHTEADLMFTTLMGDQVEPRRKFIEDNALDVKNLDI